MSKRKAIPLRLNEDIWLAMKHWAEDDLRSINAQIEFHLREALRKSGRLPKKGNSKP
ncbi:MAG: Arc family DNA binding domain-containing protein [Xanthomonadales bacterium]|nr:Arc family DNA binding domain-containing protein [Xanthomonadales bacterium]